MPAVDVASPVRISGHALVFFAFDIGFQVDLEAAEPLLQDATRRRVVRARRPAPLWFDYNPPPLGVVIAGSSVQVGETEADPSTDVLVYDFGAALITYRLPLPETLGDLPRLGSELYDHAALEADARERAGRLMESIRPAIERPRLSDAVEDYAVFAVTGWEGDAEPKAMFEAHRSVLAHAIEAELIRLSDEQMVRTTECVLSYSEADLAVIGWNAAVLFDPAPEDVVAVLQHANIELLELRVLDQELDAILDHADEAFADLTKTRLWPSFVPGSLLRRTATAQTDAAVMFEGVNNAIKLLGHQYLARLYRLAADRMDLPAWQESVQRKLDATESIYQKMSETTSIRRLEVLEWIIILLITVSILLPFTPWYY